MLVTAVGGLLPMIKKRKFLFNGELKSLFKF